MGQADQEDESVHQLEPEDEFDAFSAAYADRRRELPRVALAVNVDLRREHGLFIGTTADISTGGLFVATATLLPIGTELEVTLALPGSTSFVARTEVRWRRAFDRGTPDGRRGMGLKFLLLEPKTRAAIEHFVQSRDPLYYPD